MITPVFSRRRAERFAQLLDEAAGARRHHVRSDADGDLTDLVAVSQRVTTLPLVVEVDPEFRSGLRASLMARIEREGIGSTMVEPEPEAKPRRSLAAFLPSSRTRGAIIGTAIAGTLAVSGVSFASGDAVPGDVLYGVKRSNERAQLAFAGSDVSKGQLHLEFAKVRMAEAGTLTSESKLRPVLGDLDGEMKQGSRLLTTTAVERGEEAGLTAVEQFVVTQRPVLAHLVDRLNGPAKTRAMESLALMDEIGKRAEGLKGMSDCSDAEFQVDELGAVPTLCGRPDARSTGEQHTGPAPEATHAPDATATPPAPTGEAPAATEVRSPSPTPSTTGATTKKKQNKKPEEGGLGESVEDLFESIFG
ncbi:DUF5667 domain-containing protein [Virgisporangium aliadipatigenens]|uniref:DUF5667 domain-containing protein n=1 Tax=Virgisporangium aliadipatigenens TaxID=741659 RepID=UPI001942F902|nr:DUF5667 domain-containing protein [Virgisporangium aliadipatigenens]